MIRQQTFVDTTTNATCLSLSCLTESKVDTRRGLKSEVNPNSVIILLCDNEAVFFLSVQKTIAIKMLMTDLGLV